MGPFTEHYSNLPPFYQAWVIVQARETVEMSHMKNVLLTYPTNEVAIAVLRDLGMTRDEGVAYARRYINSTIERLGGEPITSRIYPDLDPDLADDPVLPEIIEIAQDVLAFALKETVDEEVLRGRDRHQLKPEFPPLTPYFRDENVPVHPLEFYTIVHLTRELAKAGYQNAAFVQARLSINGFIETPTREAGIAMLHNLAATPHTGALLDLVEHYDSTREYAALAEIARANAEKSHIPSLLLLGNLYYNGYGVPQDRAKANECYHEAFSLPGCDHWLELYETFSFTPQETIDFYNEAILAEIEGARESLGGYLLKTLQEMT